MMQSSKITHWCEVLQEAKENGPGRLFKKKKKVLYGIVLLANE